MQAHCFGFLLDLMLVIWGNAVGIVGIVVVYCSCRTVDNTLVVRVRRVGRPQPRIACHIATALLSTPLVYGGKIQSPVFISSYPSLEYIIKLLNFIEPIDYLSLFKIITIENLIYVIV